MRPTSFVPLSAVTLVVLLAGCGPIYLHNDSVQRAAETAQSGFKASDPSDIFATQKKNFAILADDEAALVRASIVSRRDLCLLSLLQATDLRGKKPRDVISLRLQRLVGGSPDQNKMTYLATLDTVLSEERSKLVEVQGEISDYQKLYIEKGGDPASSSCADVKPAIGDWSAPTINLLGTDKEAALALLRGSCKKLEDGQKELSQDIQRTVLGNGDLGSTIEELRKKSSDLAQQKARAAELKEALKRLKNEIDKSQSSDVTQFAKKGLQYCAADSSSAEVKPPPIATANTNPELSTAILACVTKAAKIADPLLKRVKHQFLTDEIQNIIDTVLATESQDARGMDKAPKASVARSTTTVLKTIDLLADAADKLDRNTLPSVNALLVGLAYERHQVAFYDLLVQSLSEQIAILEEKREALIAEIVHLARALQALDHVRSGSFEKVLKSGNDKEKRSLGIALTEVNAAWNVGRYRAELADYAEIDRIRRDSLRTSQEIATAWKNLLEPAFDELVAFGKGGMDEQTLATFITALVNAGGFSAVAVRVGK